MDRPCDSGRWRTGTAGAKRQPVGQRRTSMGTVARDGRRGVLDRVVHRRAWSRCRPMVVGVQRGWRRARTAAAVLHEVARIHDVDASRHISETTPRLCVISMNGGAERLAQHTVDQAAGSGPGWSRRGPWWARRQMSSVGLAGQGHGDHHALAQAAGQLVRVAVEDASRERECPPSAIIRRARSSASFLPDLGVVDEDAPRRICRPAFITGIQARSWAPGRSCQSSSRGRRACRRARAWPGRCPRG